jgi:protein-disulfide isomerase
VTQQNKMIVGGVVALLVLGAAYFLAPGGTGDVALEDTASEPAGEVSDLGALDTPNPLGEIVLGQEDAPVTIVEYASLTCGHCSAFHVNTLPLIKEKYISNGLVKIKFRPFPFDSFATAGAMLAQCVAPKQRVAFLEILFQRQAQWISSEKPIEAFQSISRQAGLSEDDFVVCLKDEKVLDGVRQMQKQASEELGVRSTPTFFVNGTMLEGNQPVAEFEALIDPLLPAGSVN